MNIDLPFIGATHFPSITPTRRPMHHSVNEAAPDEVRDRADGDGNTVGQERHRRFALLARSERTMGLRIVKTSWPIVCIRPR